ncbi:hypothetical protein GWI33_008108 [Rhynchophorus ferrugineus]|uniref:PPIase cyclophilin-type domain-containing protein n=1 Tax=Rhynchophorus ferrugineus TaxID=354439 RepID=A0A834IH43_RHYFE|nr:hypothetical protein GWI33_008108 [Rhynchophorus ferrugineus]
MSDTEIRETKPVKFLIVGFITSEDFQKCRYAVTKLHKCFPKEFDVPDIRPLLDVEWNEFITKQQRRLGDGLWSIKNKVAVFKDNEIVGDFDDLIELIWKKRTFVFNENWYEIACKHVIEYLEEKTTNCRQLVYLSIAIDNHMIGSLLIELYNDLVPLACEIFFNRCKDSQGGYLGTPIHRIVEGSWIQCGGYDLTPVKIPCENYIIPHNRRGVISMCNNGRHKDNSTQFHIALDSLPWMDYKYVAFGQLIHGDDILKKIEEVPTYYQSPTKSIKIVKCGEFSATGEGKSDTKLFTLEELENYKEPVDILTYLRTYHEAVVTETDQVYVNILGAPDINLSCNTVWSEFKLMTGLYSLNTDLRMHLSFRKLVDNNNDMEASENYMCEPTYNGLIYKKSICYDDTEPSSSDLTL